MKQIFPNVFEDKGTLFVKGKAGYRVWDPTKSKPATAIKNGLKIFPLEKGISILYLGAGHGTTASYFGEIIGKEGIIYAVEVSDRIIKKLLEIAKEKGNICPILGDARLMDYKWIGKVDFVYQDIAQRDQVEIFLRNVREFLKPGNFCAIAIKARAIDSVADPEEIYKEARRKIERELEIKDLVKLDPWEKDHCFIVCRKF